MAAAIGMEQRIWAESPTLTACSAIPVMGWPISMIALCTIDQHLATLSSGAWAHRGLQLLELERKYVLASAVRNLLSVALVVVCVAAGILTRANSPIFWGICYCAFAIWDFDTAQRISTNIENLRR